VTHFNLGLALQHKGQLDLAIQEYKTAIGLDPKYASAHDGLGTALHAMKQWDAAIREYRLAMTLDPTSAPPHDNLGRLLLDMDQPEKAILEFHRAITLDPTSALPHMHLAGILRARRQWEEAIREYRCATALAPKDATGHYNLAHALADRLQLNEAIEEYRQAISLNPQYAEAHCNLATSLRDKGLLEESLAEFRQGNRLGAAQPDWPYPSSQWVREAESLLRVNRKLARILEGKQPPADDAERLALARLCQQPFKQLYATSARFFAEAFAHDDQLVNDIPSENRYNAACAAALAGCGQGKDADKLDEKERARLRKQAVAWLRDDLTYWTGHGPSGNPRDSAQVRQTLQHWQDDSDLVGLRDAAALQKLPVDEREACQKLWTDVADLLRKVQKEAR
jgi:tetratricopeptide (TPR) repeat protein